MKKSEEAIKAVNFFKGMLASYLGITVEDIDIDVTCNKIPNKQISQLKAEGLNIRIFDAGIGMMDSTFIEEGNTLIRFNGQYKSVLFEAIGECFRPDPGLDKGEAIFERKREDKMLNQSNNL